jgi:hypothetical protein
MKKPNPKTSPPPVNTTGGEFVGTLCSHNWQPQVTVEYTFKEAEREYNEIDLVVKRVFCTKCLDVRDLKE